MEPEKHTLSEKELRQAIAQFLVDEEKTEITNGTMELTIYENNTVDVILHEDVQVH